MQNPPTGYTDVLRGPLLLALLLPCRTGELLVRSSHQTSEGDDAMSFKATYNVLATAYLDKGDYSAVPQELLDLAWRVPAVRCGAPDQLRQRLGQAPPTLLALAQRLLGPLP